MYYVVTKKILSMTVMIDYSALKNSYLSSYIVAERKKMSIYRVITVDILVLDALILKSHDKVRSSHSA